MKTMSFRADPKVFSVKKTKLKSKVKKEETLQLQICRYLKIQYPNVIFMSDASGIRLTMGQAVKAKAMRSSKGQPDLFIAEPRGDYKGLFIELKKDGEDIAWALESSAKRYAHIKEQHSLLNELAKRDYQAVFGVGFEATKKIIDQYLTELK